MWHSDKDPIEISLFSNYQPMRQENGPGCPPSWWIPPDLIVKLEALGEENGWRVYVREDMIENWVEIVNKDNTHFATVRIRLQRENSVPVLETEIRPDAIDVADAGQALIALSKRLADESSGEEKTFQP